MTAAPVLVAGGELASVNPATLELVGSVPVTSPGSIPDLVRAAQAAHEGWAQRSHGERARLLLSVADVLLDRMDELAALITAETGKPLVESYAAELLVSLEHLTWLAGSSAAVLSPERVRYRQVYLRHKRGWLVPRPVGVIAVIAPWNFPLAVPLTQVATAVAAGNAVIVKPAEETPLVGRWVGEAFRLAGAPEGLVTVAQGPGEDAGEALVAAPGVGRVIFTGSASTGRHVAVAAAQRLCPVTLELGGKDPMLVFADADLERAAGGAAWAAFTNCGQVCAGVERIYVEDRVHDAFVTRLLARARGLTIGRGDDPATDLGPLVSEEARARVESVVSDALGAGASLLTGGSRPHLDLPGWFHEPTVVSIADNSHDIAREEVFGPVVTVASFESEDEAVGLANDSRYGLGASVWTRDRDRARRVASQLHAGSVWTNDHAYSYGACQASWGGVKESGYGRTHSKYGLLECSTITFVDRDSGRVNVPWWYPYGNDAVEGFRGVMQVLGRRGLVPRATAGWRHRRGLLRLGRRYLSRP